MPLLLALLACGVLTWEPSEANAVYEVRRGDVLLGEVTATTFDPGCAGGLFGVIARDQAGNRSEPAYYLELGPCAIGCVQACTEFRPNGSCAVSLLPPGSPCCGPVEAP